MFQINLYNIPNQEFEIEFDKVRYKIKFRTIQNNFTIADIYINNELIKSSVRCCPNVPLIPYNYLRNGGGNFFFQCIDNDYPTYTLFNKTQTFIYITKSELEGV
jgi:hypothetical protein